MEYNVPQFIEEESKVVGPFTLSQFFIALGILLTTAILFHFLKLWVAFIFSAIVVGSGFFLMFGRVEGRPASTVFFAAIRYVWLPRLYLWKKPEAQSSELMKEVPVEPETPKERTKAAEPETPKLLTPEDIKKLAQQLNIKSNEISNL